MAGSESLARVVLAYYGVHIFEWENWPRQCRRSNRPGNSQATGPFEDTRLWRVMRKHPPKG
jgi:hypothetical protein